MRTHYGSHGLFQLRYYSIFYREFNIFYNKFTISRFQLVTIQQASGKRGLAAACTQVFASYPWCITALLVRLLRSTRVFQEH